MVVRIANWSSLFFLWLFFFGGVGGVVSRGWGERNTSGSDIVGAVVDAVGLQFW